MITTILCWIARINVVMSILAHVRMPAPVGQLFMFDMLGRLGSMIGEEITFMATLMFATSVLSGERYDESWTPHLLLISALLEYWWKHRFDMSSMERSFLKAGLELRKRGNLKVRAEDARKYLPLPLPSRLAPLIAPRSSLRRVADVPTTRMSVDVWYDPESESPLGKGKAKPVFLYYHGGAWLFGSKRFNHCAILFWLLARQGFVVVSARYRFARFRDHHTWSEIFDDALSALEWTVSAKNDVLQDAGAATGNKLKLFTSGSSAGAHICASVLSHALSHPSKYNTSTFQGTVLFYPPLDIKNISNTQLEFPLTFKPLKLRRGQSLMLWFWEIFLRPSEKDKTSWSPYETMQPEKLPPMLILHGTMDSVVGMETVKAYFEKLTSRRKRRHDDVLILLEGGRHAFDYMLNDVTFVAANGISAWLHRNL